MGFEQPVRILAWAAATWVLASGAAAAADPSGLLFHVSADRNLTADSASGMAEPNFASRVSIVPTGKSGAAMQWEDDGYVAWTAPGNIYAQRGTVAFFWRPRTPPGEAPFVLFRTGFSDHSSWDMAFLRIDWNGHGFDAFVTDNNLARKRVSFRIGAVPAADAWRHIAFSWDETVGVRLFVDGKEVARQDGTAVLDAGLDQFGFAGRIISPHQVQSRYSFMRGSDIDELRVYDRMLGGADVAALAANTAPAPAPADTAAVAKRAAWLHRFGWDKGSPPVLTSATTSIRKVEFADTRDLKQWMWKGVDGIPETTWPGVYNRSRLPGRDDYFLLPDWNTYVEGGKTYDLAIPAGETVNSIVIRGAAYGALDYSGDGKAFTNLGKRAQGTDYSVASFAPRTGGKLRFTNVAQETPIQEIWAYNIGSAAEPKGSYKLSYAVDAKAGASFAALGTLNEFIAGRFPADERATVVALPAGATTGRAAPGAGSATDAGAAVRGVGDAPIVHVLIPSGFGAALPGRPLARAWNYGWDNVHDGLDGVALDIPALKVAPGRDGLVALNIRIKDPIWPARDLIDVSVSVKPGEARTLWLDTRDRILTRDSLYLTVASSAADFGAADLDGMKVRMVFKDRAAAKSEHVADRFNQTKDNWGFLVEEHTASQREASFRRLDADISDLLRVEPDHLEARRYWADISYSPTAFPAFVQPVAPAGVPLWAFRQLEDLKLVSRFINWWIDERQVPYGDFGGGLSDDVDLMQQWPGMALMGVEPDKISASLRALSDAVYKNGMVVNGLGAITTDELHAYEEGINSDSARLYLNWGEPRAVERLMTTTKALTDIVVRNPAGHMHFVSNWYGGRKVFREGPWEWQKPYSFTVMHAPILVGLYNANPVARGLVTGVIDGWMAHGKQDAAGSWAYPNEINWRTDAERVGDGGGIPTPIQSAWASWRFTGDDKYLQPILGRVIRSGPGSVSDINENAVAVLGHTKDWGVPLAAKTDSFGRVEGWDATGDTRLLEDLHAESIANSSNRMYMVTEGHWWTDRVELPSEHLQRERLGGVALRRNQTYPGHSVGWHFDDPGAAEQVAILIPGATPGQFKVIAYNTSAQPRAATMTTWNVTAGKWAMTGGTSSDGVKVDGGGVRSDLDLERSASTRVSFAPHATTILEFKLVTPGEPVERRADLGIGADDVKVAGRSVSVTVHSLGAKPVGGGTATLEDAGGKVLASVRVPGLAAPADLLPKTTTVRLPRVAGAVRVRVAMDGAEREITKLNNVVPLP